MFKFTMENELQTFVIENFDKLFDFSYLAKEIKVLSGRIDILGEDDSTIYVIELKRDFVSASTINQLKNYLASYNTAKNVIGIAAAPSIANDVDLSNIPDNIWIRTIPDVEYVPNPKRKVPLAVTLDEDVCAFVAELSDREGRSFSSMVNRIIKQTMQEGES